MSGEHFSVDGTLIQTWTSDKSVRRKDGSDDDRPPDNWHGEKRSNATHASVNDPESKLNRKSRVAPAQLSYLGHVLTLMVMPNVRWQPLCWQMLPVPMRG